MEGVSVPKGVIITDRNTSDYTKYTAFVNTNTCQYFFKTYDNPQIGTATLRIMTGCSNSLIVSGN
uniref:linear amide C-N hydrolase n=1 Tax=Clostridium sp. NkU-1 TaxID=1095009 RepID=UPI003261061D